MVKARSKACFINEMSHGLFVTKYLCYCQSNNHFAKPAVQTLADPAIMSQPAMVAPRQASTIFMDPTTAHIFHVLEAVCLMLETRDSQSPPGMKVCLKNIRIAFS